MRTDAAYDVLKEAYNFGGGVLLLAIAGVIAGYLVSGDDEGNKALGAALGGLVGLAIGLGVFVVT